MTGNEHNNESRMNLALLVLDAIQLTPKKVSEITGIAESNLSVKRKKYCRPSDKDLLAIEKTFDLLFTEAGYVFGDKDALLSKIAHKLYGKDAEFFNTHWWMYIWDAKGIGRLVLHIYDYARVEIRNLPFEDSRKKDYTGTYAMDASKRFVVLNLRDSVTGEKDLHIKMAVGYGTKPVFCLGQYCNTHENGNLESGNVLFIAEAKQAPDEMLAARFETGTAAYDGLPESIKHYFNDKHLNRISIPRNTIQHLAAFDSWMKQKHPEQS